MLVPYTPVAELSEEQRKRLKQTPIKDGFVVIDGKVVSVNELRGVQSTQTRQKLLG